MKKIEISEACLGHDVLVDDESLFTHEYDNRSPEYINNLKSTFILKLDKIKDKLDIMDWVAIAEIIASRSDEFEMNDDESKDYDKCDECGNYGYKLVYNKKENDTES